MTYSYDEDSDVLYVTFAHPAGGARYVETEKGDVIRFCQETNEIVGVTIIFFQHRAAKGDIVIPEIGAVAFSPAMVRLVGLEASAGEKSR